MTDLTREQAIERAAGLLEMAANDYEREASKAVFSRDGREFWRGEAAECRAIAARLREPA